MMEYINGNAKINLFVYGTLKRGNHNHNRFCTQASSIQEAQVWGKLYLLDAGYPALEIPDNFCLEIGTDDTSADANKQNLHTNTSFKRPEGDWDLIYGELLTFNNPLSDIPPIDQLEAFNPSGRSHYQRVLVTAQCDKLILPAWLYRMKNPRGKRLASGLWGSL